MIAMRRCLVLAAGVAMLGYETWRTAARMRQIAESLESAPAPGTLEQVIGRALGDPTLRIAYVTDDDALVDQAGGRVAVDPPDLRSWTPVERDGVPVAIGPCLDPVPVVVIP